MTPHQTGKLNFGACNAETQSLGTLPCAASPAWPSQLAPWIFAAEEEGCQAFSAACSQEPAFFLPHIGTRVSEEGIRHEFHLGTFSGQTPSRSVLNSDWEFVSPLEPTVQWTDCGLAEQPSSQALEAVCLKLQLWLQRGWRSPRTMQWSADRQTATCYSLPFNNQRHYFCSVACDFQWRPRTVFLCACVF